MDGQQCEFRRGDPVSWWADRDGRALDPGHPDAIERTGIIDAVCRHPADDSQIVAYLVTCRSAVAGTYLMTVRPDLGHQLTLLGVDQQPGTGEAEE
ncbi:hypothetical protein AB0M22_45055 [Nocardia sp. NPDC051756]|uniref:hypothetical protein n=1 Tax=Nocardia sp. NPDC051756 TaxID=3154751 RepID=UPI003417DD5E